MSTRCYVLIWLLTHSLTSILLCQVTYIEGTAVMGFEDPRLQTDDTPIKRCLQTKWPYVELLWNTDRPPSLNWASSGQLIFFLKGQSTQNWYIFFCGWTFCTTHWPFFFFIIIILGPYKECWYLSLLPLYPPTLGKMYLDQHSDHQWSHASCARCCIGIHRQ